MGLRFPMSYTNLVAYFTTDTQDVQTPLRDLAGFFSMLEDEPWKLLSSTGDAWPAEVRGLAKEAREVIAKHAGTTSASRSPPT